MFIGEYQHNLDEKGRLQIPVKFRSKLSDGAVITRGLDSCLFLYTKEEWQKIAEKVSALPMSNPKARSFSRLLLAGAMEVEFDKTGRIVIPAFLRQYAGLSKSAVLAGLWGKIEIWSEDKWREYQHNAEKQAEENISELEDLGI
ncbi:MAG: Protein MraZ [Berkelbacteria bacterium GW2011_GWA2_38_9]|uniref:Transcriptional regulator MraZ n=1 Tax=Berkelbacteria bacterium GW2011_GWA2_38_9 TaxID=1618334 RepID=A0A0G0L370_9BACT|nr:MAG: Protein MraZ [Berkelbacteria bacterium GW2011_GWA2_38_9]